MEIDKNLLKKAVTGAEAKKGAMIFQTNAPLDDRFVVRSKYALISKSAFTNQQYLYQGMVVSDRSTGEAYILKTDPYGTETILQEDSFFVNNNENYIDSTINKHWRKLASDSDLQDIKNVVSGIFQFKGVATAIDPDHTTLTIGSGSIGIPAGETTTSEKLISYGTVLQKNLDSVMYAWGTSEQPNLFFTKDLYTRENKDQTQYKKGAERNLQYINVFDTLYFENDIQRVSVEGSSTAEIRTYTVWEALDDGGTLYSLSNGNTLDIYTVTSSSLTLPDKLATGITSTTYKYYEFTPFTPKYIVTINSQMESITASSANNGHVYQLGEEEYASNGNMWVQLGSPKTDWIVL